MGARDETVDHATIAAIATATGGGVGIIRVSGPRAISLARRFFRTKSEGTRHGQLSFGEFVDSNAEVLDEGLVATFYAPRSLTGEDVVEFHLHGGHLHLEECLEVLLEGGAKAAGPGEFLQRAFLNDKVDLTKAESIADLIAAQTGVAARHARRNLIGGLRDRVEELRESLIRVRAAIEVNIDFVEEDVPLMNPLGLAGDLDDVRAGIRQLVETYRFGRLLRDGAQIVLAGAPNAGKSSIFNALYGSSRAIVTATPGTTRDTLTESLDIAGVVVTLTDTAGVRDSDDEVERMGVERAIGAIRDADLLLVVRAPGGASAGWDDDVVDEFESDATRLNVWSKSDLVEQDMRRPASGVSVSTRDLGSIAALKAAIAKALGVDVQERPTITRARQCDALTCADEDISRAVDSLRAGESPELAAVDLQSALEALAEITGATTPDDVLDRLFATFCIGK